MKPKSLILLTALLLTLLIAPAAAASVTDASGNTYTTYDQIYASTTLSSSEKLSLVQEMAGWTPELEAYMEWKNSGGDVVSVNNSSSSDYGWDEGPSTGLEEDMGTTTTYTDAEQAAYDAAYEAYQTEFAANYAATAAYTGSGSGTQSDPYIITTPAEFQAMADDLTAYYKLGNDIDTSAYTFSIISNFAGTLDGDGYAIIGISSLSYAENQDYYTLFYNINGATIKNVNFQDINIIISRTQSTLAGLFAQSVGPLTVSNCIFTGTISATSTGTSNANVASSFLFRSAHNLIISNCIVDMDFYSKTVASASNAIRSTASPFIGASDVSNCITYGSVEAIATSSTARAMASGISQVGGNIAPTITKSVCAVDSITASSSTSYKARIFADNDLQSETLSNNYAVNTLTGYTPTGADTVNGADVSAATLATQSLYQNTLGWDFVNTWYWDSVTNTPQLQVFRTSVPPTISSISATPATGGQQDTYTLSVSASTTATGGIASYQWYGRIGTTGEWQAISGATASTYTLTPGDQFLGDVYFKCVVTGADGGVVDSYDAGYTDVKISVVLAPQITSPAATPATGPLSQTVQLSASVTSTETATYQWQELIDSTWTNISGATAATATVNIADSAATTHSYRLQATNIGGTTTSETVTYQSVAAPTISGATTNPTSGPLTQSVTLSATVSGADTYQWQELSGSTWTDISGATAATATVNIADSAATTHSYRLQATNIGGTTTSETVTYQSVAAPTISGTTTNPTSGPLTQSVTLSATVSGADSYQWQELSGTTWTDISGATAATATVNIADTAATTHTYRLQATNIGGTTTSATVTYTSVAPPTISSEAANPTTGPLTQSVTLSATVSGAGTYQWQELSGSTWTDISGATAATATVNIADTAATTHSYRLQATNIGGTTTSETVTYQSVAAPTISGATANPTSGPLTQSVTLSATVSGADTYQWQELSGSTWTDISGATTSTYTITISDSTPTLHSYRVIVSNVGGSVTSDTVTYQSSTGPIINTISATPTSGPLSQTVQLSVTATSANTITYQWQELSGSTWTDISGATTPTYSVSITDTTPTTHRYRVMATDVGGTTPSETITYTSVAPPTIQAANINPAIGKYTETITLSAEVSGADTYQWQKLSGSTWQNITGATTNPWVGTVTVSGDTQYRLQATSIGGTTTSQIIQYTIAGPANIQSLTATPSVVAIPGTTTLQITGTNIIDVEWQKLSGSTWQTIGTGVSLTESITNVGETTFRALVEGADGTTTTTNSIIVLSGYAPSVDIIEPANNDEFPSGATVQFQATVTGTDVTYEWDFGVRGDGYTNINPTSATYSADGYKTVTLRAESIFGTATDSITFLVGKAPRPMQTETINRLDETPMEQWMQTFTPNQNTQTPDLMGVFSNLLNPYTNQFGNWVFLLLFAVPYLIIWIRQKNILIPSILGVLFGSWILVQFPSSAVLPAIGILVLSISGGIYGIYVKYQR